MTLYFENLIVWQKSFELATEIHKILQKFPKEKQFALIPQMRRSSVSIPSNIAEWSGRWTNQERKYFYNISKGSAMELQTQILLAKNFWYITKEEQEKFSNLIEEIVKILYTLTK